MNARVRRGTAGAASHAALVLLLAACASAPPEAPPEPDFDAVAAVATVRAAGTADGTELDVQPLRDGQVEDLVDEAHALEMKGLYRPAADRLDVALGFAPDDPNVLQRRAEVALLLGAPDDAERFALRAQAAGTEVGPLCRRHWETVVQARAAGSNPPPTDAGLPRVSAGEAARRRDACTVAPPPRY